MGGSWWMIMGVMRGAPLITALTAVLVAVIGSNSPEEPDDRVSLLEGELNLLALGTASGEGVRNLGSDRVALDAPDAYYKIPNFEFEHLATVETVVDRMECQRKCNQNKKCRSYSFSEPTKEEKEESKEATPVEDDVEKAEKLKVAVKNPPAPKAICKLTPESLHYRLGWSFFTKAKDVDWQGQPHLTTENFHEFPGLEYQEPGWKVHNDVTVDKCKADCAKDPKCGAFSYNSKGMLCRHAGRGINYNKHFAYYEKPQADEVHENAKNEATDVQNARLLKAQEKQAKKAGEAQFARDKAKREKEEERFGKKHEVKRSAAERSQKHGTTENAEKSLVKMDHKERDTKDALKVQGAFVTGYFEARGASQEQKTKEVALKKMALQHQDYMLAREAEQKSGEFRTKKKKSDHLKLVTSHEMKMAEVKEQLMKVKNKQRERELRTQEEGYDELAKDESVNIRNIKRQHEEKLKSLKRWTENAQEAILAKQDQLDLEESSKGDAVYERQAAAKKATEEHEAMIKALKDRTEKKVKEIIEEASNVGSAKESEPQL